MWEEQNGIVNFLPQIRQVAMYSICAESGEDINLEISATRKDNRSGRGVSFCDRILAEENQYIWLEGSSGGREGIGFAMGVRVCSCGGRQYQMGSRIIVEKARKVLICFTGRTTFDLQNRNNGAESIWLHYLWTRMQREKESIFRIIKHT